MAEVNVKVVLSTDEARAKLNKLTKEQERANKKVDARRERLRDRLNKSRSKTRASVSKGQSGKGIAGRVGAIFAIVLLVLAIAKQVLAGIQTLGREIAKVSSFLEGFGRTIEDIGTNLSGFIGKFVGQIGRLKAIQEVGNPFAQAGLNNEVNLKKVSGAFAKAADQEFQNSQRQLSLTQSNTAKSIFNLAGIGGGD
jgi:hypothetical protein